MAIEESDAIVLKYVEFSESSLILTLFTRKFGKIDTIAKGARRLKNPFESALDLLTQISVSFLRKDSEALDLLTEAKLSHRFRPKGDNLGGLYAACYLVELLDAMTAVYQRMPTLYDKAVETLLAFEQGECIARDLLKFEWSLLGLTGLQPSTRMCVECGEEITSETTGPLKQLYFAHLDGGVLCPRCQQERNFAQLTPVSSQALRLLEAPEDFACFSKSVQGEVRRLMNFYLTHLLGRKPKMFDYLKEMVGKK